MKKIFVVLFFLSFFNALNAQAPNGCEQKITSKILIVGDSWGQFMFLYKGYKEALRQYGFADITELGGATTIIGAQTGTWTRGLGKKNLRAQLLMHPEIEDVVLMLGGNDFVWDYDYGDPIEVLDNSIARTNLGMDTVVNIIREIRPDVRIILPSYDYPNFIDPLIDLPLNPYFDSWESFGFPNPYEANTSMQYIEAKREAWSLTHPNIIFVQNLGLMQYHFGQKDSLPDTSPLGYFYPRLPPYAPKTVPFPFGNQMYPTPQKAMGLLGFDAYHLGPAGFQVFAANHIKKVLLDKLRGYPTETILSDSLNDGWVNSVGEFGTGEIKIGKDRMLKEHKGILSFNTKNIPDDAIITGISIFITRKKIEGNNPLKSVFPNNAKIDIMNGPINGLLPEAEDFSVRMDMEDVGCFVGQANRNNYSTRIDLQSDAFSFLNKTGITQFRISYNSTIQNTASLVKYYNGGAIDEEPLAAHMDIHYELPQQEKVKQAPNNENCAVFPLPAKNEINLRTTKEIEKVSITDVLGRQLYFYGLETENKKIDLGNFSKGLMVLRIYYKDGTIEEKKIIKS
ncbi:MAG: T9SS type A sorting domain-containing protein [Bacteroidetes bacterium]|nr:T9SS type A sorting domain-containing protein [Bacteroidota bacterium]